MRIRGGYLILMFLLLKLKAGQALPHQQQQQQQQQPQYLPRYKNELIPVGNDYGPVIHISSGVLQLLPDEQTQLLLLSVHGSGSSSSSSSISSQSATSLAWPQHIGLPGSLSAPRPTEHVPQLIVSDNLDFQQLNTHTVKSHGR